MPQEVRFEKKKFLREVLIIILLLCSFTAISINPDSTSLYSESLTGISAFFSLLRDELGEVGIGHILAAGVLIFLYHRELLKGRDEKPFCLTAFIIGGIFALFLIIGLSFSTYTNFDFIFYRKMQFPIAVITFAGYWAILYTCLKMLYAKLDRLKVKSKVYAGFLAKIEKHFFLICVIALLVFWIIQALPFFPGSVPHDGRYELNQFFGLSEMTTHHPVAATVLMGAIYSAGKALFGTAGGCIFYVAFQSICGSIVFGMICDYIRKKTRLLWPGLTALAFFCIAPMFWTYMQTLDKSALYMIIYAWFGLEYVKLLWKDSSRWGILRIILAGVLVCILRNEGVYIIIPMMILLLILLSDKRKLAALALIVVVLCSYGWNTVFMNYLGIDSLNQVEDKSLFLQMIARYDLYYGDELTDEDIEIINTVISYENLGERYDPELADPVKSKGYRDTTDEEWKEFWKLWFKLLKKHPAVYLEAVINEVYGYIDPLYFYYGMSTYQLYNKESITDTDTDVVYSEYVFSYNLRDGISDAVYSWNNIPVLSLIVNPAAYTWMGIILIGALLRKKKFRDVSIFAAPFIVVLVCFASPVNGMLRYSLPVMAAMPLYFLAGLKPYWSKKDGQNLSQPQPDADTKQFPDDGPAADAENLSDGGPDIGAENLSDSRPDADTGHLPDSRSDAGAEQLPDGGPDADMEQLPDSGSGADTEYSTGK